MKPKRRRVWRHKTTVYKDGPFWRWKCRICGHAIIGFSTGDVTQQLAFKIAHAHTFVGGYDIVE